MSSPFEINLYPGPTLINATVWKNYLASLSPGEFGHRCVSSSHHEAFVQTFIRNLEQKILETLDLGADYRVLFVSGSARETFIRLTRYLGSVNLRGSYHVNGMWSNHAKVQADLIHPPGNTAADYVHFCANETAEGYFEDLACQLPAVVDVTSCLFAMPLSRDRLAFYASGQKIFSFPGFSIVIIRKDALMAPHEPLALSDNLYLYGQKNSCCVTPPISSMLLMDHFLTWLQQCGGVDWLYQRTKERAITLYELLTQKACFTFPVHAPHRSATSLVFHALSEADGAHFSEYLDAHLVKGFRGHKAVGGYRFSNYPGLSDAAFARLTDLIERFECV